MPSGEEWIAAELSRREGWQHGNPRDALRLPVITSDLGDQIKRIEPSRDATISYYPCRVELRSGEWVDRVYVQEALAYIATWGVWPWEDRAKNWLPFEDITRIESSPTRIAADVANKIYAAGESGMGYTVFTLLTTAGRSIACITGNAVDWVDLPDDVRPTDIVDVLPHEGRRDTGARRGASYAWSLYRSGPE